MNDLPLNSAAAGSKTNRHDSLQKRVESMVATPGYFGAIFAQSGLGKTYCAEHFLTLLRCNDVHDDQIVFNECIETDNGHITLEKLEALVDQHLRPTRSAALKSFVSGGFGKNIWAIGKGVLKDIAARYNLKHMTDAVTDAVGASIVDISSKQNAGDRVGERLVQLRDRIARSGQRYFLVVDAVEKMADPGVRFLTELSKRPIDRVRVLIFVDKGWGATGSLQLKELKASLQTSHMTEIDELHGLSSHEIQAWFRSVHHKELSDQDAQRVFVDSDSGRPSIIKAWLATGSDDINRVADHGRTAWGKIMLRLDALPAASSKVLNMLACAYPHDLPLGNIASVSAIAPHELIGVIANLRSLEALVEDTSRGIRCGGRNLADCIKSRIGEPAIKYCRGLVLDSAFGNDGKHKALPPKIMENLSSSLLAANHNEAIAIKFLLESVENSLESGACKLAEIILSSIESLPENAIANWSDSNRVHQARLRADLAGQFGEYEEAIRWAQQGLAARPDPTQAISLQLSIGDKLLQLGNHMAARKSFREVRREAIRQSNAEQYVEAFVRTVKALFDTGKYISCIRLVMFIDRNANSVAIKDKTRCLCNRWLARVFSQSSDLSPRAMFYAQTALEIANRLDHGRQVGNCRFVLGEVNRYKGSFAGALYEYHIALDASRISGNKDLEIYSLLGLTLTNAALSDWSSFDSTLEDLKICMTFSAPTEELYVLLLNTLRDLRQNNAIAPSEIIELVAGLRNHSKNALADCLLDIENGSGPWIERLSAQDWKLFVL